MLRLGRYGLANGQTRRTLEWKSMKYGLKPPWSPPCTGLCKRKVQFFKIPTHSAARQIDLPMHIPISQFLIALAQFSEHSAVSFAQPCITTKIDVRFFSNHVSSICNAMDIPHLVTTGPPPEQRWTGGKSIEIGLPGNTDSLLAKFPEDLSANRESVFPENLFFCSCLPNKATTAAAAAAPSSTSTRGCPTFTRPWPTSSRGPT